jgi:hypothetical protein
MDSSKLGAESLMYNISMVKNSYDRGSILKWFFRSPGSWISNPWKTPMMIDMKNMQDFDPIESSLY